MSTKQNKFYETLRQTQANTFSEGLNMDLHPLTTPNTILTDCVNGTMITYNDNEFVLQNERGNTKITQLSKGFIPIGVKEHNGIIYIVSHNLETKCTEIGTYPSPIKSNITKGFNSENTMSINYYEKNGKLYFDYTKQNPSISYYDYNLIVSNYDTYNLEYENNNPLFILEHYILNNNGQTKMIELFSNKTENRFTHSGEGILGYKYRPLYIDSFDTWITPANKLNTSKLNIFFSSNDVELLKSYKNYKFNCDVEVKVKNSDKNIISDFYTYSYNFDINDLNISSTIEGTITTSLDFNNISNYIYNNQNKTLKSEDGNIYDTFIITSTFYIVKDDLILVMDNLKRDIESKVSDIYVSPQVFDVFKYRDENNSGKLSVDIILNLRKYDPNWSSDKVYNFSDATYKLSKVNKYGDIESIKMLNLNYNIYAPKYKVISSNSVQTQGKYDLKAKLLKESIIYYYSPEISTELSPLSVNDADSYECTWLNEDENITNVQYMKRIINGVEEYVIVLSSENGDVVKRVHLAECNSLEDMIDERWVIENEKLEYKINDLEYEPNTVYILQLTYTINGKNNIASFVIITSDKMLSHQNEDRMDQLTINNWYDSSSQDWNPEFTTPQLLSNDTFYKENILPINEIIQCKSDSEIQNLAKKYFWKYVQIFDKQYMKDEIASVKNYCEAILTLKGNENFSSIIDARINNQIITSIDSLNINIPVYKQIGLNVDLIEKTQTTRRKYFSEEFSYENIDPVEVSNAYYNAWENKDNIIQYDFYKFDGKISGFYFSDKIQTKSKVGEDYDRTITKWDWLNKSGNIINNTYKINRWKGRCMLQYDLVGIDQTNCKNYVESFSNNGLTVNLMTQLGLSKLCNIGNIIDSKNIQYSGDKTKVWIRGKKSGIDNYVLVGMDLLTNENTTKLALETIITHGYLLEKINKPVLMYKFKANDNNILKITEINTSSENSSLELPDVKYKIYPQCCNIVYKNYDSLHIQSLNNLNPELIDWEFMPPININKNLSWNSEILIANYLTELAKLINNTNDMLPISENFISENEVYFDFNDLINDNYEKVTIETNTPSLLYDSKNKVFYIRVTGGIESFNYISEGCFSNFDWNYSEDFLWKVDISTLQQLNLYHNLWFYKLTNYEPK